MAMLGEELTPFKHSFDIPFSMLSRSTLMWLSNRLNIPMDITSPNTRMLQDWRGLAEIFGCDNTTIANIELERNPCFVLLTSYETKKPASIFELLDALKQMERYDIIADDDFYQKIDEDTLRANSIQNAENNHIDNDMALRSRITNTNENYSAFICHHPDDTDFVKILELNLERKHNLKLCIPERDLLPGGCSMYDMAQLIKTRCEKILVVLSPKFLSSPDCNFQISFAMALDIVKKERKIIPIIYETCQIPDILCYLTKVDYTRENVREWFWQRLVNSLDPSKYERNKNTTSIDSAIGSMLPSSNHSTTIIPSNIHSTTTIQQQSFSNITGARSFNSVQKVNNQNPSISAKKSLISFLQRYFKHESKSMPM